jgi:hypothetical protein
MNFNKFTMLRPLPVTVVLRQWVGLGCSAAFGMSELCISRPAQRRAGGKAESHLGGAC